MPEEVYLKATKEENPAKEFWGFDPSSPPAGNAAIPFSELDIHSAADVVDGLDAGDYGEKAQQLVKMLYAADKKRDRHDIADLMQYQIKTGRWPSLSIFFAKNSDWARWWELEKGRKKREAVATPYVEQNPNAIRFADLPLKERAEWMKLVSQGEETVGPRFKRLVDKIVGDTDGDYLQAAHEIGMDPDLIDLKIINPASIRAAEDRINEIERLSTERAADKKAAAAPPPTPQLTETQKEIRRLNEEADLEETWGPGGVKMKELKPGLRKRIQK